jgi:hypothetical protein
LSLACVLAVSGASALMLAGRQPARPLFGVVPTFNTCARLLTAFFSAASSAFDATSPHLAVAGENHGLLR